MKTMSLFSLNRIYKPNRHTPTPLTQTHTISFPRCLPPLPAPSLFRQHRRTETQLRRGSLRGFHQLEEKSEGNCSRWWEVLSACSGVGANGWIEGTFCSSCAGSDSHIVPDEAGCHLWFKGPRSLTADGKRTRPLWRPVHSFLKEH